MTRREWEHELQDARLTKSSSSAPSAAMKVQSRYSWMVDARGSSAALVPGLRRPHLPRLKGFEQEGHLMPCQRSAPLQPVHALFCHS